MKSTKQKTKRPGPGRPRTTGAGEPMVVRMHPPQLRAIDEWIGDWAKEASRPEAIRRLTAMALKKLHYRIES